MTPKELAAKHPKLYHITNKGAWANIQKKGLLSTSTLLDLFEVDPTSRISIEEMRRKTMIPLHHEKHGSITINDNIPLLENALANCLDDNLTVVDWLKLLNRRVFFWANEKHFERHVEARLNKVREKDVLVIDTLSLADAHADNVELCAINSGVTFRKAARRGLGTFTPMLKFSYREWSKLRGKNDKVQEVTVLDGVKDIATHVIDMFSI